MSVDGVNFRMRVGGSVEIVRRVAIGVLNPGHRLVRCARHQTTADTVRKPNLIA
jgi:hypothetical protein